MSNYEIEFTIKKKIKLQEENNELYAEPEYLDIEGSYVTAEGAVADRYVASEPVIISKETDTSQELETEMATEAVDESELNYEPETETTAEPDELTASESEAESISEVTENPAAEIKEEKEPQILDKAVGDFDDDDDYDKKDVEGVSYQKL